MPNQDFQFSFYEWNQYFYEKIVINMVTSGYQWCIHSYMMLSHVLRIMEKCVFVCTSILTLCVLCSTWGGAAAVTQDQHGVRGAQRSTAETRGEYA